MVSQCDLRPQGKTARPAPNQPWAGNEKEPAPKSRPIDDRRKWAAAPGSSRTYARRSLRNAYSRRAAQAAQLPVEQVRGLPGAAPDEAAAMPQQVALEAAQQWPPAPGR